MPTRHGQTGWRHSDPKVQKEFERIARRQDDAIQRAVDDAIGNSSGNDPGKLTKIRQVSHNDQVKVQDVTMLDFQDTTTQGLAIPTFYQIYGGATYGKVKTFASLPIITGTISLNILPDRSTPYNQRDTWKRANSHIRPDTDYNWYGWAVYNYIDHGWKLQDPNDFILHLTDLDDQTEDNAYELEIADVYNYVDSVLSEEDMEDPVKVRAAIVDYYSLFSLTFIPKYDMPTVHGLNINELVTIDGVEYEINKDIIVLRGVHKPDMVWTYNTQYTADLEYLDEAQTRIRTNLKFRYTLIKGSQR